MRCNKCGEEYKENQAFCLRCGNPIHVVPDFNLIEAELANDVGALMDSNDEENTSNAFDEEEPMSTIDVPVDDISMELKMVDISRGRFNFEEDEFALIDEDDEDEIPVRTAPKQTRTQSRPQARPQQKAPANKKASKDANNSKAILKNVFIILGCLIAVALVIVLLYAVVFSGGLNESNNFQKQYNIAKEYYENNSKTEAITEAEKAVELAYSSSEQLKARKLLHDVYLHFEKVDADYLENLQQIIKLDASMAKYNEAILDYYYNNQMFDEFNVFLAKFENSALTEGMQKYIPAAPVANLEGGHYDTFLTIELTAGEGTSIYYTMDGSNPKENASAFVYTDPIQLNQESETIIMAYALDANGIMSGVYEVKYTIKDVEVSGPVVTPSSGKYSEYQKISVTVPEGCTVYYTTDGTEPTSASTLYTEPFDMPYNRSDYKFIMIDANGNVSSVTSVTYDLSLDRNVNVSGAEDLVMDLCIEEKELDPDAKDKDGLQYKFTYKSIEIVNNKEYYMIEVSVEDGSIESEFYAVNTNTKTVTLAVVTDSGYEVNEVEEETE